jgi:predicted branched-subunit amino acid permease
VSEAGRWYFLGAGLAQWSAWQASTAVGIAVGAQIPPGWALDFAIALTFIALIIPTLTDRPAVAAALAAGIVAVAAAGWPYKLGLVLAAVTGILVGLLVEGKTNARGRRP